MLAGFFISNYIAWTLSWKDDQINKSFVYRFPLALVAGYISYKLR